MTELHFRQEFWNGVFVVAAVLITFFSVIRVEYLFTDIKNFFSRFWK